jgi:hypothetical protein
MTVTAMLAALRMARRGAAGDEAQPEQRRHGQLP